MKKTLLLLCLLTATLTGNAQLQNSGFENWYTDTAGVHFLHNWQHEIGNGTPVQYLFGTARVTSSQQGMYALRLSRWYSYTWDQIRQRATVNFRPQSLQGYYTYTDTELTAPHHQDTALVRVYLTLWNSANNQPDTIGYGALELTAASAFTAFACPITYSGSQTPDSVTVLIQPTKWQTGGGSCQNGGLPNTNGACSYLTIDDLALSMLSGTAAAVVSGALGLFPNPASTHINLPLTQDQTLQPATIFVADAQGRTVLKTTIPAGYGGTFLIPVNHLPRGLYLFKLLTEKELRVAPVLLE